MRFPLDGHRYFGFFPPYRALEVLEHPFQMPRSPIPVRGSALLWNLRDGRVAAGSQAVRARPPGVALAIVLPPTPEITSSELLVQLMASCRPHSILPYVEEIDPEELVMVLRRFPTHFPTEVTEYLTWRGIEVDIDTRRLIRKTLELSCDLQTVSGLARALYMSRRALGRRFMSRGLPVPSHWLHFGRVLRGSIRLQDPSANLFNVGCDLGYPDGFAFSNQLKRLTGLRPSLMKRCFGWEWIVESWLFRESEAGGLSSELRAKLFPARPSPSEPLDSAVVGEPTNPWVSVRHVAEDSRGRD